MSAWLAVLGVFALAWALTALHVRVLHRHFLDQPVERSSHTRPTPTGGGLALVIALDTGVLFVPGLAVDWLLVVVLAALLGLVGLVDDWRGLGVPTRLGVQFFAAVVLVLSLAPGAMGDGVQGAAGRALLVLALVWLVNAFNFMDGIDGLAGSQAVFMALAAAWLAQRAGAAQDTAGVLLCTGVACAGFLAWNWPPARVFMGDTGSLALGFLLGAAILVTGRRGELAPAVWAILWAPLLCDTGLTLLARALRREPLYRAHREHAYQRLARRWGSHRRVTLSLLAVDCAWLLPLAVLTTRYPDQSGILVCLAYAPLLAALRPVVFATTITRA